MGTQSSKGKKGCRKAGRNKIFALTTVLPASVKKNKLLRLKKHVVRHPTDLVGAKAIDHCKKVIKGY